MIYAEHLLSYWGFEILVLPMEVAYLTSPRKNLAESLNSYLVSNSSQILLQLLDREIQQVLCDCTGRGLAGGGLLEA